MIFNKHSDNNINRNDNHHDHSDNSNKEHKNNINRDNHNIIYHYNIIMMIMSIITISIINNSTNNLRAYAMPLSYRKGCEHERCDRNWSEQAEAVTRRAADLSLLKQVQARPVWGSTAVHLYVFYLSWRLWEVHLCGFYVSGRSRGGTYSNDL